MTLGTFAHILMHLAERVGANHRITFYVIGVCAMCICDRNITVYQLL